MKRTLAMVHTLSVMLRLLTGCGGKKKTEIPEVDLPAINAINLGEDYQDITATVKVLTNRTATVDDVYTGYAEQFHQLYPNITVEYEGVSDYGQALNLCLPNGDWGDICFTPPPWTSSCRLCGISRPRPKPSPCTPASPTRGPWALGTPTEPWPRAWWRRIP